MTVRPGNWRGESPIETMGMEEIPIRKLPVSQGEVARGTIVIGSGQRRIGSDADTECSNRIRVSAESMSAHTITEVRPQPLRRQATRHVQFRFRFLESTKAE